MLDDVQETDEGSEAPLDYEIIQVFSKTIILNNWNQ